MKPSAVSASPVLPKGCLSWSYNFFFLSQEVLSLKVCLRAPAYCLVLSFLAMGRTVLLDLTFKF